MTFLRYAVLIIFALVLNEKLGCATAQSRGQPPHRHHQHMERHHAPKAKEDGGAGILHDESLLADRQHIEEDLSRELTPEQISKMSPGELEYHYFKVHDFDKNGKLDGLEILVALGHVVHMPGEEEGIDVKQLPQLSAMIDEVFEEADNNQDGFLSYYEYARSRQ